MDLESVGIVKKFGFMSEIHSFKVNKIKELINIKTYKTNYTDI